MRRFPATLCAAAVSCALALAACGQRETSSATSKSVSVLEAESVSGTVASALPETVDLAAEAQTLGSTPGRTALALIVCRLDPTNSLAALAQKNAADLLSLLQEIAVQKSRTLESLDQQFGLRDILASEHVYVLIHANAADTVSGDGSAASAGWEQNFEKAYAAAG